MKLKLPVVVIVAGVLTSAVSVKASLLPYYETDERFVPEKPQGYVPGIKDFSRFMAGISLYNTFEEDPAKIVAHANAMTKEALAAGAGQIGAPTQRFSTENRFSRENVCGRALTREELMRTEGGTSLNDIKRRNSGKNRGGADVFNEFFMHPLRFIPFATSIANHYDADKLARCKERIHWGIPVSDEECVKCAAFDLRLQ